MRYIAGTQHLTPAEAMATLGVTRAQLYTLVRNGKLRATWHAGRLYIPELEMERFLRDETERTAGRVVTKLLRAIGVRVHLIFSWKNGHGSA
jgi:excisionase family DNA binding protein